MRSLAITLAPQAYDVVTQYYVRAYATHPGGTVYGDEETFTTCDYNEQDNDLDTVCAAACSIAGLSCGGSQLCDDSSGVAICDDPVPPSFTLVYDLNGKGNSHTPKFTVTDYDVDDSAALQGSLSFTRIGYLLQLNDEWVWAEVDDFSSGNYAEIGIPGNYIYKQAVTGLTVHSNSPVVAPVSNASTGAMEFFEANYNPNPLGTIFDDDDTPGMNKYGSMQIHNCRQTVFGINRFQEFTTNQAWDYGIGHNVSWIATDWTFAENANFLAVKRLRVFVQ